MSPGADEPGASDRTESAPHLPSSRAAVTARLTIEPLAARHAEELFAALDDPLVGRYIGGPDVTTLAELRERIAHLLAGPEVGSGDTWANWVVVLDAVIIGRLEATFHDGIAEVGYVFGPRWWGRGYGTEVRGLARGRALAARRSRRRGRRSTRTMTPPPGCCDGSASGKHGRRSCRSDRTCRATSSSSIPEHGPRREAGAAGRRADAAGPQPAGSATVPVWMVTMPNERPYQSTSRSPAARMMRAISSGGG